MVIQGRFWVLKGFNRSYLLLSVLIVTLGCASPKLPTFRWRWEAKSKNFKWPLRKSIIISHFSYKKPRRHDGIDLRASIGTPVYAAADGEVLIVSNYTRGYGKLVILKHPGSWYTVYAHHQKNKVIKGQKVKVGELIALSGNSGRVTGPHLHFEIRHKKKPVNPLELL